MVVILVKYLNWITWFFLVHFTIPDPFAHFRLYNFPITVDGIRPDTKSHRGLLGDSVLSPYP